MANSISLANSAQFFRNKFTNRYQLENVMNAKLPSTTSCQDQSILFIQLVEFNIEKYGTTV